MEFFLTQIEGLRVQRVTCCTNLKARWGKKLDRSTMQARFYDPHLHLLLGSDL